MIMIMIINIIITVIIINVIYSNHNHITDININDSVDISVDGTYRLKHYRFKMHHDNHNDNDNDIVSIDIDNSDDGSGIAFWVDTIQPSPSPSYNHHDVLKSMKWSTSESSNLMFISGDIKYNHHDIINYIDMYNCDNCNDDNDNCCWVYLSVLSCVSGSTTCSEIDASKYRINISSNNYNNNYINLYTGRVIRTLIGGHNNVNKHIYKYNIPPHTHHNDDDDDNHIISFKIYPIHDHHIMELHHHHHDDGGGGGVRFMISAYRYNDGDISISKSITTECKYNHYQYDNGCVLDININDIDIGDDMNMMISVDMIHDDGMNVMLIPIEVVIDEPVILRNHHRLYGYISTSSQHDNYMINIPQHLHHTSILTHVTVIVGIVNIKLINISNNNNDDGDNHKQCSSVSNECVLYDNHHHHHDDDGGGGGVYRISVECVNGDDSECKYFMTVDYYSDTNAIRIGYPPIRAHIPPPPSPSSHINVGGGGGDRQWSVGVDDDTEWMLMISNNHDDDHHGMLEVCMQSPTIVNDGGGGDISSSCYDVPTTLHGHGRKIISTRYKYTSSPPSSYDGDGMWVEVRVVRLVSLMINEFISVQHRPIHIFTIGGILYQIHHNNKYHNNNNNHDDIGDVRISVMDDNDNVMILNNNQILTSDTNISGPYINISPSSLSTCKYLKILSSPSFVISRIKVQLPVILNNDNVGMWIYDDMWYMVMMNNDDDMMDTVIDIEQCDVKCDNMHVNNNLISGGYTQIPISSSSSQYIDIDTHCNHNDNDISHHTHRVGIFNNHDRIDIQISPPSSPSYLLFDLLSHHKLSGVTFQSMCYIRDGDGDVISACDIELNASSIIKGNWYTCPTSNINMDNRYCKIPIPSTCTDIIHNTNNNNNNNNVILTIYSNDMMINKHTRFNYITHTGINILHEHHTDTNNDIISSSIYDDGDDINISWWRCIFYMLICVCVCVYLYKYTVYGRMVLMNMSIIILQIYDIFKIWIYKSSSSYHKHQHQQLVPMDEFSCNDNHINNHHHHHHHDGDGDGDGMMYMGMGKSYRHQINTSSSYHNHYADEDENKYIGVWN